MYLEKDSGTDFAVDYEDPWSVLGKKKIVLILKVN